MEDLTPSNPDRVPSDQLEADSPTTEGKELLLADLVGAENVDPIYQGLDDQGVGMETNLEKLRTSMVRTDITGGDLDDDCYQAEVVGEEAVGGQTPTPDQNVTEDLQKAVGITAADGEPVRTTAKLEWRDHHPWQLSPESSEDYQERLEE